MEPGPIPARLPETTGLWGSITQDRPATLKRAGLFKAADAPASEDCPVPLP